MPLSAVLQRVGSFRTAPIAVGLHTEYLQRFTVLQVSLLLRLPENFMRHAHTIPTVTPSISNNVGRAIFCFALTAALAMTAATAQVASGTTGIDATGNAQSEMAACATGRTQQDTETCMKEVRNASQARRAGQIDNAGGQYGANSLERCNVLIGEDKFACQARVVGYGNPQGSVAGGGVVTEIETVVVPLTGNVTIQPQTANDTILVVPAAK